MSEAHLSQLSGPSIPHLSQGELLKVANSPLPYSEQQQLVEALVIFLRLEASQYGLAQTSGPKNLAESVARAL